MDLLSLTTQVLRDPDAVANSQSPAEARASLARLAPPLLLLACTGAAILGGVAGSVSGPLQSLYAAVKLPVLFLLPPMIVLPLVHAFAAACDVRTPWTRLGLATLAGLARSGLLAAAAAPLLWLPFSLEPSYHLAVLCFAGTFGLVLLPALGTVSRAVPKGGSLRGLAVLGTFAVLALTTAQTGWLLRPFVARPAIDVTFLRPVEGDVFSALAATRRSADGNYQQDWQPRSTGLWERR